MSARDGHPEGVDVRGHGGRSQDGRFVGTTVPEPEFAGDAGGADTRLTAALAAWAAGSGGRHAVLAALLPTRLLVPVVAVLDSEEPAGAQGPAMEKDSHLATVTLVGADGRRGMLAFTSTAALAAWRPDARPVPAGVPRTAQAALQESADALLLDVAGPVPFPVRTDELAALAGGELPPPPHTDPEVVAALGAVVTAVAGGLAGARLRDGEPYGADVELTVAVSGELARRLADRLARDPVVSARCPRGVAIRQQPARRVVSDNHPEPP